jgi:hypothetical protein
VQIGLTPLVTQLSKIGSSKPGTGVANQHHSATRFVSHLRNCHGLWSGLLRWRSPPDDLRALLGLAKATAYEAWPQGFALPEPSRTSSPWRRHSRLS